VIPNCIPFVTGRELKYLKEAVDTGWLSPVGPFVDRFEAMFAEFHDVTSSTAVSSGTAAIHLGLIVLGVKPDDLVLCPSLTFVGTANPIRYCGADPVFLDIDAETLNLDPDCLKDFLQKKCQQGANGLIHSQTGRRISALMVVHLYGNPASMRTIIELAREYGLPIIEDAAESLGAQWEGQLAGTIGDIGCFSFNGNKVITTGGGGILIARENENLVELAKHLSTQAKSDSFEFVHDRIGYNYRMSNLCAAVGVAQMEELTQFIERKREHAAMYDALLSESEKWEIVKEPEGTIGTYWMVLARKKAGVGSVLDEVREWAKSRMGVRPVWHPLHKLPIYGDCIYFGGETTEKVYNSTFCLPSSVGLTEKEIQQVVETIDR
jgi:perosamine synthetase